MTKVAHWLQLANPPHPLNTKCSFGTYKGWYWRTICQKDPDWILWLITESKVLLEAPLHQELVDFLRRHQWD